MYTMHVCTPVTYTNAQASQKEEERDYSDNYFLHFTVVVGMSDTLCINVMA